MDATYEPLRRRGVVSACLGALIAILPIATGFAATQYLYDDVGRLVLAVNPDGTATSYEYDPNGNATAVYNWGASGPAVGWFVPSVGRAGTPLTIHGSGFDPVPQENSVVIGGVAATVTAATPTSLVTAIPYGAVTGPISVTVGGVTGTSTQNVLVLLPAITGFNPVLANPGMSVTLTGANLHLVSGGTSVSVAGTPATTSSVANNQIVFAAPNGNSGPVTVTTPYGEAQGAGQLTIVPSSVPLANVVDHALVTVGGAGHTVTIGQANRFGLLQFSGIQGQHLSIQVSALSLTPSGGSISYNVFAPGGTVLRSGTVSSSALSVHLPPLPATGTYLVSFGSGSKTSVQAATTIVEDQPLPTEAGLGITVDVAGQSTRFTFAANQGDDMALALTGLTLSPSTQNQVRVHVYRPSGSQIGSFNTCYTSYNPGCSISLLNLSQTGTYTVVVNPAVGGVATMGGTLTLSNDVTGTLVSGTPLGVNLTHLGQQALLSFAATEGQTLAVHMGSVATTPGGKNIAIRLYDPAGTELDYDSGTTEAIYNLRNLAAGTYTMLLAPTNGATASMQVTLADGSVGTLPSDGTGVPFSTTVRGQTSYYTFTANAGDDLGLGLTGLTLTPSSSTGVRLYVYRPSGSQVGSFVTCTASQSPGCSRSLLNLPETGSYTVIVQPAGGEFVTMSGTFTLSHNVTGTLVPGTPLNVSVTHLGQQALLSFSASAGQTLALHMGSVATTPSGKNIAIRVYDPAGTQIEANSGTTQEVYNLTNLAAGTYTMLLIPANAATGSMQVTLADGSLGTLASDGTSVPFSTTVRGQKSYYTFTAAAGDDLGLALTGLTLNPSSTIGVRLFVYRPSGSQVGSFITCGTSSTPGCSRSLLNLPETGTYTVIVDPAGQFVAMAGALTLSHHVTGELVLGTPLSVSATLPGQHALLSFNATAGQSASFSMSSISTTPGGKSVRMYVYNPSGSQVGTVTHTAQGSVNLTNLVAGTYSVLIAPFDAATASMQVQVQ
jgi:YD repeat-containing protein